MQSLQFLVSKGLNMAAGRWSPAPSEIRCKGFRLSVLAVLRSVLPGLPRCAGRTPPVGIRSRDQVIPVDFEGDPR